MLSCQRVNTKQPLPQLHKPSSYRGHHADGGPQLIHPVTAQAADRVDVGPDVGGGHHFQMRPRSMVI